MSLDIRRLHRLEALYASDSAIEKIIMSQTSALKIVKIDDTLVRNLSTELMPKLENLSLQETEIDYIDLRNNIKLKSI